MKGKRAGKEGRLTDLRRAPAVSHSIHFFSRPPMNRRSAMKKRSYVCKLPLSALVTSQVNTNWCINFLTSASPDSTFFSRLCPCPLSFFSLSVPSVHNHTLYPVLPRFPLRLISLRCSSLAFFPCFPLFALLYLPLDTSVLPLNLTSPYFSSSHPLGASSLTGTPVTLLTLQCIFFFS